MKKGVNDEFDDSNQRFIIKNYNKKILIYFILFIVVLLGILYYFGLFSKECEDNVCFNQALQQCKPIDYVKHTNNNVYFYRIYRSFGEDCSVKVTLVSVSPGSNRDIKDLLEGKSMKCSIPKSLLQDRNLDELENSLEYCHGELKEGIYELIIKRLYGYVIGNLNEIIESVNK